MNWVDSIVDEYLRFLKDQLKVHEVDDGWFAITTPFLNPLNDFIEIYIRNDNEKFTLTDGGETLHNLEILGGNINKKGRRKDIFESILRNHRIQFQDGELAVQAEFNNVARAKHNLLSAMVEILDLSFIAPSSKSLGGKIFTDNVREYFDKFGIITTPKFKSIGATGLEMTFDFQIAGRRTEILINTFNSLQQNTTALFLFNWGDIREARQRDTGKAVRGVAIINDELNIVQPEFTNALTQKHADFVLWSEREQSDNLDKFKKIA